MEHDLFSGALLGGFAILILNNLIIFFTLRYAGYLWYALLLLAFSLQVALLNGLLQDLAPQAWLNQIIGAPALVLGLGLGATQSRLDWGQAYLSGGLKGLHTGLYAGAEAGGLYGQTALTHSQCQANGPRDIDLPSGGVRPGHGRFSFQGGPGPPERRL